MTLQGVETSCHYHWIILPVIAAHFHDLYDAPPQNVLYLKLELKLIPPTNCCKHCRRVQLEIVTHMST